MQVAIFGGTGFVGSHIVDALVDNGMTPRLLVRDGSEARVRHAESCRLVGGDLSDTKAVEETIAGADAVIYNVGILREQPAAGVRFDELHVKAAQRAMALADRAGVTRFLLMSANGVKPRGTAYQHSKFLAEEHLRNSNLAWTIVRPSVVFGDPRGRIEFATQLRRDVIASPLPAPLFYPRLELHDAGAFELSPVHVENVAAVFCIALQRDDLIGETLHLGGPEQLSWRAILERIARAGGRRKLMLPVPAMGVSAVAALLDRFEHFPITRDQVKMLLEGNTCSSEDLVRLGIDPIAFDIKALAYLADNEQGGETWHRDAA